MSRHHDLELAIAAAKRGASVVRDGFGLPHITTRRAEDQGVFTEVDRQAEDVIIDMLRHDSPFGVVAEESGELPGTDAAARWVVNPIDGTSNYARDIPLFAVSIALLRGLDIELGVIIEPLSGACSSAMRGGGATLNETQRLSIATVSPDPIVLYESGYGHDDETVVEEVAGALGHSFETRRLGSTALELALLARGSADGVVSRGDHLWDIAAGILIVQEAGGTITDWAGRPWVVGTPDLVASAPALHGSLLDVLRSR